MDKTDFYDKMDALVNNKENYEVLKRVPTPALQRKLNSKLLDLTKTDAIYIQRYNRRRCRVPQPLKIYGLPELHKPNIPMRPIVSFCGSPTYQLSKYLTIATVLKTFVRQITTQTTVDWELYWRNQNSTNTWRLHASVFWCEITVHQYSTSAGSRLHWDRHQQLYYWTTATYRRFNELTEPLSYFYVFSVQQQALQTVARNSYGLTSFRCCCRNRYAKQRGTSPRNLQTNATTLRWRYPYSRKQKRNRHFHKHLNRQNADIQFTKEIEESSKIPFLDCLVTRDNNKLRTTIYVIAIQWSLLIAFETTLFCDNVVSKCWLVIGSKTVMRTRPRSNFTPFLHKTAGKILDFVQ